MSIGLAKSQLLALSLTLAAVGLISACARNTPSPPTGAPPALARAVLPSTTQSQATTPRTLEGKVVSVADGDTITLLDAGNRQIRIRLQGIDAPESGQAFSQVSKRNLSDLIFDRQVVVEYEETDRYGRTLGKVLASGHDVNLEQVKAGLAWHYKYYQNGQSPDDERAEI